MERLIKYSLLISFFLLVIFTCNLSASRNIHFKNIRETGMIRTGALQAAPAFLYDADSAEPALDFTSYTSDPKCFTRLPEYRRMFFAAAGTGKPEHSLEYFSFPDVHFYAVFGQHKIVV